MLEAVAFEESDEDLEDSLGVGGEAAVAVGAEALDKMGDHVVQTCKGGAGKGVRGRGLGRRRRSSVAEQTPGARGGVA